MFQGSPGGTDGKNPPANAGDIRDVVQSLGQKDPLGEKVATQAILLPQRVPWTEKPGGLQSIESQSWT